MITRIYFSYLLPPTNIPTHTYFSRALTERQKLDHTLYLYMSILRLALGGLHFDDSTEAWY
jgi:hypothetical protein